MSGPRRAGRLERLRAKGFEGPHYRGFTGTLRFAWEAVVSREEVVLLATRTSLAGTPPPARPTLELQRVDDVAALRAWADVFDAEYYAGFLDDWERIFGWGERLVLAMLDGAPAGYFWVQDGRPGGFATYYGPMAEGDARILRAGVLPSHRRRGVYTQLARMLAEALLEAGARRVFVDCTRRNVPSLRALARAGFRPLGRIHVLGGYLPRPWVRWASAAPVLADLETWGIPAPPA